MGAILQYIYIPFSYVMKGCLWLTGNNYFFALFFFALIFQILLFPLAIKQQKSQVNQAKIKPKEQAIRKKYAGRTDRVTQQKMNQEIQEMYQQEGFNPLSGCLPLLIQLPLILILYGVVRYPIQYSSNFSTAAEAAVKNDLTQISESAATDKLSDNLERLVIYYMEDIRENLTTEKAGQEANDELVSLLGKLSTQVVKENDAEVKYDNGYVKYRYNTDGKSAYAELAISDVLTNYSVGYVDELQESGALKADYAEKILLRYQETEGNRAGETVNYSECIPNFTFLSINLLHQPSFTGNQGWRDWILLLIPVLVFVTSFLNTLIMKKFNPPAANPNGTGLGNGILMRVGLPLMSAAFTLMFPAAIGVYWIWRTLIDMVKPLILSKMYPMPTFTEEDYAEAERELKGKPKKKKVITIEVDEDDNSYADLEVSPSRVNAAKPKETGKNGSGNAQREELPYRRPSKIEMLSVDDEDAGDSNESGASDGTDSQA
ncbi:MAG: membrane protein insertase YidC [Clostridia bacterium]|nr:membrane protein insertase YidC [Clostridia bacterium]